MSKAEMLAGALDRLLISSPEVEAAAVVSGDGLPMASALPSHVQEERLAAMSAALLTLGDRAAEGLGKGALQQVFIEGAEGHVILMSAGGDAVLVTVVESGAKIGLVLFEVRRTATEVAQAMDATPEVPEEEYRPEQQAESVPAVVEAAGEPDPYSPRQPVRPPDPVDELVQPTVTAWE